jgi:hypothetical protein
LKNTILAKYLAGSGVLFLVTLPLVNCENSSLGTVGNGPQGAGGKVTSTSPFSLPDASSSSAGGKPGDQPTADANCGTKTYGASKMPVDVLLVLDRSGSMNESIAEDCCCSDSCKQIVGTAADMCADTSNCAERWSSLTSAVGATIDQTSQQISWGLKFFPSPSSSSTGTGGRGGRGGGGLPSTSSCTVSTGIEVKIPPDANSVAAAVSAIKSQIASTNNTPVGGTPTAQAIRTATDYLKTVTDNHNRVILLATDGEPNCASGGSGTNSPDVQGTDTAVKAAVAAGFKVYVIGIGPAASMPNLDQFAVSGGTEHYYPVASPGDLAKALSEISAAVTSCTFTMDQAPPEPNNVAVYVDGNLVQKDPANGWSFGSTPQTVLLNGSSCELVKSGGKSVQVLFGCGSPPPPVLY